MPPSLERKTILLVDDDAQVLASTTQLLQGAGYEVIPAASAEDAMAIVLTSRPFDVLVTDYALPRMNGAELVENVRRLRPKLVAVLTAGAGNLEQLQRELAQIPILPKPYASDRLFKALEASVATHRLRTGEQ
jgi:DNA-binding NtrC family response regulator